MNQERLLGIKVMDRDVHLTLEKVSNSELENLERELIY